MALPNTQFVPMSTQQYAEAMGWRELDTESAEGHQIQTCTYSN